MGKSKDLATGASYQDQTESDARYVNTSGDTMTGGLNVTGGDVGIGTISPSSKLHINETTAAGTGILLTNDNNTSGTYSDIKWQYSSSDPSYGSGIRFKQLDTTHGGQLEFFTDNTTGTYTQRMTITEDGYVTMPYQPAFRAYLSTEWTTISAYVNSGWTAQYNRGNCFNQGTFTAPVDGVYNFTVAWDARSTQSTLNLERNGSYAGGFRYEPTGRTDSSWETHSYSADVQLNANDYVKLYLEYGGGTNPIHMGGNQWGFFAGHLVG